MLDLDVGFQPFRVFRIRADAPGLLDKVPACCVAPFDLGLELLPALEPGAEIAEKPHHSPHALRLAGSGPEVVLLEPFEPLGPLAIVRLDRCIFCSLLCRGLTPQLALGGPQLPGTLESAADLHEMRRSRRLFETEHRNQRGDLGRGTVQLPPIRDNQRHPQNRGQHGGPDQVSILQNETRDHHHRCNDDGSYSRKLEKTRPLRTGTESQQTVDRPHPDTDNVPRELVVAESELPRFSERGNLGLDVFVARLTRPPRGGVPFETELLDAFLRFSQMVLEFEIKMHI